jgi:hypothetical protein
MRIPNDGFRAVLRTTRTVADAGAELAAKGAARSQLKLANLGRLGLRSPACSYARTLSAQVFGGVTRAIPSEIPALMCAETPLSGTA